MATSGGLAKYGAALVSLALCSACAAPAAAPPVPAANGGYTDRTAYVNGRPVTAARPSLGALSRFPSVRAGTYAKARGYQYIINDYGTYASIFDWPKSDDQIGSVENVGGQGCTNVLYGYGKKTFWIVAGADQIEEFSVVKKPIRSLSVSVGMPSSCAMDTGGDLAVGILSGSGGGDIVIFKHAKGKGTVLTTPLGREYFDGYDPNGNLFFDGFTRSYGFALVELPKGSQKPQVITTSNTVDFPGSVQWDGKYLVVTDQGTEEMYQYTVSGTTATLEGTVQLTGSSDCAQTWIGNGVVFCADADNSDGEVFKYPAGGSILATLAGSFVLPLGVTISEK